MLLMSIIIISILIVISSYFQLNRNHLRENSNFAADLMIFCSVLVQVFSVGLWTRGRAGHFTCIVSFSEASHVNCCNRSSSCIVNTAMSVEVEENGGVAGGFVDILVYCSSGRYASADSEDCDNFSVFENMQGL